MRSHAEGVLAATAAKWNAKRPGVARSHVPPEEGFEGNRSFPLVHGEGTPHEIGQGGNGVRNKANSGAKRWKCDANAPFHEHLTVLE
jgi:hypothetical protein